jgi:mono/diheme cytochrome c family protein
MLLRSLAAGALAAVVVSALSFSAADSQTTSPKPRYGKPISEADIAAWNIDIRTSDGKGLPPGKGSVAEGKAIYDQQCVACHGEAAKGGPMYGTMVGGIGSFKTNTRVLTPGSMYPYAPILFDYVRRTMPMTAPQTLTNDQVYALAAYILNLNGLVPENAVMDAESLNKVAMPNRDNFVIDDRPDTKAQRCMKDCQ